MPDHYSLHEVSLENLKIINEPMNDFTRRLGDYMVAIDINNTGR